MNKPNVQDQLSTLQRLLAPTPTYFRAIQITGLFFFAIGWVVFLLLDVGVTLPLWLALLGEKATLAVDAILIALPQLTVDYQARDKKNELENIK